MINQAMEFFITYVFLPYSVILYFILTGSILRHFIKEWLKERREKRAAKATTPRAIEQSTTGGKL